MPKASARHPRLVIGLKVTLVYGLLAVCETMIPRGSIWYILGMVAVLTIATRFHFEYVRSQRCNPPHPQPPFPRVARGVKRGEVGGRVVWP